MRADRGDQGRNICSLSQRENGFWQQTQKNIRQLFNATHSLKTTSMDKHVFYCQGDENETLCSLKDSEEALCKRPSHLGLQEETLWCDQDGKYQMCLF